MSKSPKESTRFTATGVWAHTRPGGRATTLQFADPAPKNETPQQKVKRLREAANRAKMAQVTRWDYMYLYGRMAADAAHRFTVYGLIFATGCVGVLAVFSIGDMIVYNRRKRAIYFAEEERVQARILEAARNAVASGTASPAQAALVTGIAEEQEAMERKKAERKAPSKLLWWLHGDWKEDQAIAEQRKLAVEEIKRQEAQGNSNLGIAAAVQEARANDTTSTFTSSTPVVGGPLDNTAEKAVHKWRRTGKGLVWIHEGWIEERVEKGQRRVKPDASCTIIRHSACTLLSH
ncbi:cytochrome oxidase c assembly-domain-containing protein [Alternaria rosae]|uniref:cytochrome oxidase c assembly-domain-containing protein n=1 Tax=Alternaria rosae TaxID=1187941 RepID=UPI001E8DF110|nr:cytochrome oxidase c assembly-domain-containing protein [Alternaria rosae]KAH6845880.1 cytochrome oxidase c assembly-domain-containing protein [Alternaria rosae]